MLILSAVLNLVLAVVLNPALILTALVIGLVALFALVFKIALFVRIWTFIVTAGNKALQDAEQNPVAFIVVGAVYFVNSTVAVIGAVVYVVVKSLPIIKI